MYLMLMNVINNLLCFQSANVFKCSVYKPDILQRVYRVTISAKTVTLVTNPHALLPISVVTTCTLFSLYTMSCVLHPSNAKTQAEVSSDLRHCRGSLFSLLPPLC